MELHTHAHTHTRTHACTHTHKDTHTHTHTLEHEHARCRGAGMTEFPMYISMMYLVICVLTKKKSKLCSPHDKSKDFKR